ncbi:hypothetical protein [Leifsonia sp. NCR5]|uniref:hypothetical protein n=1 Tax=Leifsonia sp. NCR5 TaxID=1978342 RepID=UPI00117A7870|nr:hypothetical protein [Leifsonia sp. NCR5]
MRDERLSTPKGMMNTQTHTFERYTVMEFQDELREMPLTYQRSFTEDVSEFAAWLRSRADAPLLAVGAGGSLAAAQLAAALHKKATGQLASIGEPMDIYQLDDAADSTTVLLVTASGSHSDSLAACAVLAGKAAPSAVFSGKRNSKGADLLAGTETPVFEYELLPDTHGWVAVNSLLAQAIVLARAYAEAFPDKLGSLPSTLAGLAPEWTDVDAAVDDLATLLESALGRELLVFLHGPDTKSAAVDLDSKFAESDLGWLSVSEYRNFAHGRYQMILPRQSETGVLAFYSRREESIALATLGELPEHVPHVGLLVPGDSAAAEQVGSIVLLLLVVGALGRVRQIDVGWGSRSTFGDVIYDIDLTPFHTAH